MTTNENPSAAEIVASPVPSNPQAAPVPAPAKGVVKDDKTLDIEISETEDKLHRLRQQKQAGQPAKKPAKTAPATPAPSKTDWLSGWKPVCEE